MKRWFSILIFSLLSSVGVAPAAALAQSAPALVITVRNVHGAGVAGATVVVRDGSGQRTFATATTDTAGRASIERVPVATVRVAVSGALPQGMPLTQEGDDHFGMRVWLDAVTTSVDFRVEPDGRVVPDPTMFAREGVDAQIAPAPLAPTLAGLPSAPPTPLASRTALPVDPAEPATPEPAALSLRALLLVLALAGAIGAVVMFERRAS
jgi:hypothetical protein